MQLKQLTEIFAVIYEHLEEINKWCSFDAAYGMTSPIDVIIAFMSYNSTPVQYRTIVSAEHLANVTTSVMT